MSDRIFITRRQELRLPAVPNYVRVVGAELESSIDVAELSDAAADAICNAWVQEFRANRARRIRERPQQGGAT